MIDLSARLLAADSFESRLAILGGVLARFGVGAINAAELSVESGVPYWFHSTLAKDIRVAYLAGGHWQNDCIIKAARRGVPTFVWDARRSIGPTTTSDNMSFDHFLRDTGATATISVFMPSGPMGDRRALTAVFDRSDLAALDPRQAEMVVATLRLAIPWLDAAEDTKSVEATTRIMFPAVTLTLREREALRLLAGGLRVARVAEAMGISEAMVAKHLVNARRKLSARTREQAVARSLLSRQIKL